MKEIFTPKLVNWLLATIFGVVIPVAGQSFIAGMVSDLNSNPSLVEGEIVQAGSPVPALIGLSILFFCYILVLAYQVFFIVKLRSHSSVWAFTITATLPFIISITVPLLVTSL